MTTLPSIIKPGSFQSFLTVLSAIIVSCSPAQANPDYSVQDFELWPARIIEGAATPKIMINASNDHQLYFKAYNDYSDLDYDGVPETTYIAEIDYYGYFDSTKCYEYVPVNSRFEPRDYADANHYCTGALDPFWSGNFLNWASMTRIDVIRKILFGGHRRVDNPAETVLERSYLPHDAHSWAKHYDGPDIEHLTPFQRGIDYDCDRGDLSGCIESDSSGSDLVREKIGITFGNTTDVDMSLYKNIYSEEYNAPPLLKVVRGDYSLWAANERWQITWDSGAPFDNHPAGNGNNPDLSGIHAYATSPPWSQGIGEKNYVVRVLACVKGLPGEEKCKRYPGPDGVFGEESDPATDDNYKPIGLFQFYGEGDNRLMEFGMVAGSYNKHASGGVIIRNMGGFDSEINAHTDGTFPLVAEFAGGPMPNNKADGLINAWSLFRIIGYDGDPGYYNTGDNCKWGLSSFDDVTRDNQCRNWGNPFAEIYYQSINYLSGNGVIGAYRANSSTGIPGLAVPQNFVDPLDETTSCAPLSVINLNSSVISYDFDELDSQSYGPSTIWDVTELPGNKSSSAMTDIVGAGEGIHDNDFHVGLSDISGGTGDQLCTPKTVTSLGEVGGLCPEAPRLLGSYRVAGLAYYAHIKDIRPDTATGSRALKGTQKVYTYSVAMASALPVIDIPNPITGKPAVTLLPACRNASFAPAGNCAIVDFKIVYQETDSGIGRGRVYINWEDSEQGGDYDQDMWGTLDYSVDGKDNTISITTDVYAESTTYALGFGYTIGGTTEDGFHVHSGTEGFTWSETGVSGSSCGAGCQTEDGPSTKTYTLGTSQAKLLQDPLWYASKWGGFLDSNDNNLPDIQEEWDSVINATGRSGQDGIPDTYFFASHPRELEDALDRVLQAILKRTSSGTAAAIVSSNVRGEGALYQAYYEPLKLSEGNEASWIGTVQALWLDSYGLARQDCSPPRGHDAVNDTCVPPPGDCEPNGRLDNYCIDQVAETFYDELEGRTRVRVYQSNNPYEFEPYSMQGVVKTFANGSVTIAPNSMQGNVKTYNSSTGEMTIVPYEIRGTATAYDPETGEITMSVPSDNWTGPTGSTFDMWRISVSGNPGYGFSTDPVTLEANSGVHLTINPAGTWITAGDTLTLQTQAMVGLSGDTFSNWSVACLHGDQGTGEITNHPIILQNWDGATFTIDISSGDFSSCSMVQVSTFDMKGTACNIYNDWQVTNLDNGAQGTSATPITLMNSLNEPACPKSGSPVSLIVDPDLTWMKPGERLMHANFQFTDHELSSLGHLWNAREQLYLETVPDTQLATNRAYTSSSFSGRHITTWIDSDLDNEVDPGEHRSFDQSLFPYTGHGFFDVDTRAEAETVVDYVRGIEIPGTRSRTIRYSDSDTSEKVMRLGDIINSTPTVAGPPQEAFNLLYSDSTYTAFRKRYQNRRTMIYAGGNDGLLHAFNGGFLNIADDGYGKKTIEYSIYGKDTEGSSLTEHPLGSEIWAYAPKNTLAHLQWLKDPDYGKKHVFLVDGEPRIFDANIFTNDAVHPHGWGTVLVVGMNLGGGTMEIDTASDDSLTGNHENDNIITRSAYVLFDITDPESPPQLLGEIQIPDGSFTTVYPAVVSFRDTGIDTNCSGFRCNRWYLLFGTGPDNPTTAESSQAASIYLFELSQLTTSVMSIPADNEQVPAGCTVEQLTADTNIITCATGVPSTFMGRPVVIDWDLDFYADTAYFGLVGDRNAASGALMRFGLNNDPDPIDWSPLNTHFQTGQPISIQPVPAVDRENNKWIFIGTGRSLSLGDKTSTATQSLYGIREDNSGTTVARGELLNVTDIEVYADRTLTDPPTSIGPGSISTFDDLEDEIDNHAMGWYMDLPPIIGTAGSVPATRSITDQALLGGVLFSSVFQPSENPCTGEGLSRLYGLYYKTGTAYPGPSIFDTSAEDNQGTVKHRSLKYLDLGRGVAAAPAIHSGTGSGDDSLSVFTQLSTGEIIRKEVTPLAPVRTGKISWEEH